MHIIILVTCRTQVGPGVPICKIQIGLWCTCRSISTKLENPYWVFELSELLQASSVYSPSTTYIFDLRVTLYAHQWRCSPRCSSFPYLSGLQACFTLEIYGTCTGPRRQTKSTLIIVIAACKWYPQMKIITTNAMRMKRVHHHHSSKQLSQLLPAEQLKLIRRDELPHKALTREHIALLVGAMQSEPRTTI